MTFSITTCSSVPQTFDYEKELRSAIEESEETPSPESTEKIFQIIGNSDDRRQTAIKIAGECSNTLYCLNELLEGADLKNPLYRNYALIAAAGTGDFDRIVEILPKGPIAPESLSKAFLWAAEKDFTPCSALLLNRVSVEDLSAALGAATYLLNFETLDLLMTHPSLPKDALNEAANRLIQSQIGGQEYRVIESAKALLKGNLSPEIRPLLERVLVRNQGRHMKQQIAVSR